MKTAFISPLRYPGGKAKLGPFFARVLASQQESPTTYAEPYAGGAGAGLFLLSEGYIDRLLINDLNPGIAAFWRAVLGRTDEFVHRIMNEEVSLDSWHLHRATYLDPIGRDDLELGFSTFFLNRCNRSGILTARPIGGLSQAGNWKIDARFNRNGLVSRVRHIQKLAKKITVTQKSALDFISTVSRRTRPALLYVDPPYLVKGEELYMSAHSWEDHEKLAVALARIRHPWILTYDVDERVRNLYPMHRCLRYSISHTAQTQKVGREFMLFSENLKVEDLVVSSNREGAWVS
ncbi:DNA adenine methylase [Micromonospora sp. HUAS LYJ1]|uniref:DNA adenine methylase n=1 Tax=Micromonospora sp. HUAS LYJ1 TaxID=3061626 RepID=UPI0034A0805A